MWGIESEMQDGRGKFDIFGMYTLPWAQRSGCATRLCDELLGIFELLVTDNGSNTGGEAFLQSYGFVQHEVTGQWYCIRPVKKEGTTDATTQTDGTGGGG